MKDLYSISRPQLITLWAFAIFFGASSLDIYGEIGFILRAISIVILFGVVFYTFGWRDNQNKIR